MTLAPAFAALLALVVAIAVTAFDAAALALWRRWLGGMGGDFPRSIKITVLCLIFGAQYVGAVWLLLDPEAWTFATALAGLPIFLAALCLWFVYRHNNGGEEGRGGRERYGWPGGGYRDAYLSRDFLTPVRLFGLVVIHAHAWTEEGEAILGARTGLIVGVPLGVGLGLTVASLFFPGL